MSYTERRIGKKKNRESEKCRAFRYDQVSKVQTLVPVPSSPIFEYDRDWFDPVKPEDTKMSKEKGVTFRINWEKIAGLIYSKDELSSSGLTAEQKAEIFEIEVTADRYLKKYGLYEPYPTYQKVIRVPLNV